MENDLANALKTIYGDPFKMMASFLILWFWYTMGFATGRLVIILYYKYFYYSKFSFKKENWYNFGLGLLLLLLIMGIGYIQSLTL